MTTDACPSCSGERLYNITYRHSFDCGMLTAEDATEAADHERLLCTRRGSFVRSATTTEAILAEWLGMPNLDKITDLSPLQCKVDWKGVRHRLFRVGGRPWFDADTDTTP